MAVELHQWIGFILIANFFVWLGFYLFTDKITVYHPDLSPRRHFAGALRQAQYYGYGIFKGDPNPHHVSAYRKFNPLQSMLYQIIMLLLVPIQFYTGILLWDVKRFSAQIDFFGGVRVVDTVHVLIFIFFVTYILVHAYLGALGHTWSAHYKAMLTGYEGGRARRALGAGRGSAARPGARLMRHAGFGATPTRRGRLPRFAFAQPDIVLLHQRLKVGALHPGFLRAPGGVPAVALERLEHEKLLDFFHRFLARDLLCALELVAGARDVVIAMRRGLEDIHQVRLANDVVRRQDCRPVYGIFQLPHVSRPIVGDEGAHRSSENSTFFPSSSATTLRKWKAKAGMSSRRSRSGGVDRKILIR